MSRISECIERMSARLQQEKAKPEVRIPIINGLSSREQKYIRVLHFRLAFLYKKITNMPTRPLSYERDEITAIEWTLKTLQEHFDHLNICSLADESEEQK